MFLATGAVVLLVAALWGPAKRAYDAHRAAEALALRQAAIESEHAAATAELQSDRAGVLSRIRALQERNDHTAALALASRYRFAHDPEFDVAYGTSAGILGRRARVAADRALIARQCVATALPPLLDEVFTADAPGGVRAVTRDVQAVRATSPEDLKAVRTRITSAAPGLDVSEENPAASRDEPHNHRNRIHPYTAAALLDDADDPQSLICVWDVSGMRSLPAGTVPFRMKLWLAPRPGSDLISPEPLSYTQGPPATR